MSRCFPFPPPGYERKLTLDDGNLLVKFVVDMEEEGVYKERPKAKARIREEKDKERKEKKHRKDKEKKEGKEKDKERSKDKHREQDKEKKEKHKHKDKDKKKDKKRSRDEKSDLGESSKAEKAGSNSPHSTDWTGGSSAQELGRRLSYGEGAVGSYSVNNNICTDQRSVGFPDSTNTKNSVWSGGKDGSHQVDSGQRDVSQTKISKVTIVSNVNGVDQSRRETVRSMPKESYGPTERREMQSHYESESKGDRSKTCDQRILEREMDHGVVVDPPKEAAFLQELGRRIRYENGSSGSQVVAKEKSVNQTRADFVGKVASDNVNTSSVAKQTSKFGNGNQRMELGQRENFESGDSVANVHSVQGLEQRGREMVGPAQMSKKLPIKGAERNGFGEGGALGSKEKSSPLKTDDSNRAQREKGKQGGEFIIKLSRLGERSNGSSDSSKRSFSKSSIKSTEGIGAKRKEPEANVNLLDSEVRPNKVPRTTITLSASKQSSGHSKLDSCAVMADGTTNTQKSLRGSSTAHGSLLVSTKPPSSAGKPNGVVVAQDSTIGLRNPAPGALSGVTAPNGLLPSSVKPSPSAAKANGKMVAEEYSACILKSPPATVKADGMMAAHAPALVCTKPPSDSAKSKRKEKSSSKPRPHRDTKYLSEILSVPKIDDWCEFDDQDWLFSNSRRSMVTESGSTSEDVEMQVWSKAVHIAPADVYALPYVIPY